MSARNVLLCVALLLPQLFAQTVVTNPTTTQSIAQPAGTRFNVNNLGGILFADQFAWSQSPSAHSQPDLTRLL
jgi:hypothetical protein